MCSWSKHFTQGPLWKPAVASGYHISILDVSGAVGHLLDTSSDIDVYIYMKSISWTHEKTSGKDIIRFYFCSPNYSGTHVSDTQWCRSSSFISPLRNVSWREVQGNSLLLLFEGIESSCPESVLILQGPVRCHVFCEALPKPKPKIESINLTFLFPSVVLSLPQSWSPVLGAFSVPLIQARNLVLFILVCPQSRHRAVLQCVELYWICTCKLTRKHIPKQSISVLPRGEVSSEVGKGGPCKMRKSWYAVVLFVGRLTKGIGSFLPSQSHCG